MLGSSLSIVLDQEFHDGLGDRAVRAEDSQPKPQVPRSRGVEHWNAVGVVFHVALGSAFDLELQQRIAENALKELNQELEQRVEERTSELAGALDHERELSDMKSRFVSMASHEFRTPLTAILSSASLLQRYTETEQQDKREKNIDRIKTSVKNLTDVLNDFLCLLRI